MMTRQRGRTGVTPGNRFAVALSRVMTVGIIAAAGTIGDQALAQDRGRPSALGASTIPGPPLRLEVPSMIIGAPASETSLGIVVGRDAAPANSFVRIRGLGPQMTLTEGHVIAPGAWAVPLSALPNLRVVIPASTSGRLDVAIAVVAIDGGVVAEAKTILVAAPAALAPTASLPDQSNVIAPGSRAEPLPAQAVPPRPPAPIAALPPPKSPPTVTPSMAPRSDAPQRAPLSSAARERSEGFVARGRKLLDEGNIASARLFFRRAADEGYADGALALGATFDPSELERLRVIGIRPDPAEARHWYERARELGAGDAAERRLQRLGSS